jgi:hypothetical protein
VNIKRLERLRLKHSSQLFDGHDKIDSWNARLSGVGHRLKSIQPQPAEDESSWRPPRS